MKDRKDNDDCLCGCHGSRFLDRLCLQMLEADTEVWGKQSRLGPARGCGIPTEWKTFLFKAP